MDNNFHTTIANQFKVSVNLNIEDAVNKPPTATAAMLKYNAQLTVGIIEQDLDLLSINGWLSPEGNLYPCKWRHHTHFVRSYGLKSEKEMESSGWIKLTQMEWLIHGRYGKISLTKEQKSTIKKWHEQNMVGIDNAFSN